MISRKEVSSFRAGSGWGDAARCLTEEVPPCRSAGVLEMGGSPAKPLAGCGQAKEFRRHLYPSLVQKAVSKLLDAPASVKSFKVTLPLPIVGVPDLLVQPASGVPASELTLRRKSCGIQTFIR